MTVLLRLDRVSKSYGAARVLDQFCLDVEAGEFLTLLGPSGCGKTTTLRLLGGFEMPDSGRVLLEGTDITDVPAHRRPLNTVFQQYALFPHMSVTENVAFGPRMAGTPAVEARARAAEMLARVGLDGHARKKPAQLSGGQQQRVALARALVNHPRALLLDEPLSALDVTLRRALQLELKRIQSEIGTSFVFVTHDQEEALTMSGRIAVMNGGCIEQLATPEEIYRRPASQFVARFVGEANILDITVQAVERGLAHGTVKGLAVAAHAPAGIVPGPARLMIRPEHVRIGDGPAGLSATLVSVDYQGASLRCELRAEDGSLLLARVPADMGLPGPGSALHVTWHPEHAWILPR